MFNISIRNTNVLARFGKADIIDSEAYLLACSRYIELNPVNANMVKQATEYKWSSHLYNAYGKPNRVISPHDIYNRLGPSEVERQQAYASLFKIDIDVKETQFIRNAAHFSMPTGDSRFKNQIERALNRKIGYACKGRPVQAVKIECK